MENKNQIIEIKDDYKPCLEESCNSFSNSQERRPKGHVKVFEVDEKVDINENNIDDIICEGNCRGTFECEFPSEKKVDDDNLIVYAGREWLASAIFGVNNTNITATYDERVYWLSVGSGGATSGDPFNNTNPTNNDTDLDDIVMISATDTDDADYRTAPWDEGYYKKPISGVEFEQDESNNNKYLVAKATIIIAASDANGNNINEAGLYSASSDAGGYAGNFTLFSRVTFPTIVKNATRQLVFVWYIYT